jgi:hypothetical protein
MKGVIPNKYDYRLNFLKVAAVVMVVLYFPVEKERIIVFGML